MDNKSQQNSPSAYTNPRLEVLPETQSILVNLAKCQNLGQLFDAVLVEGQHLTNADGGTLYLLKGEGQQAELEFSVMRNQSLNICLNAYADDEIGLENLKVYSDSLPNHANVATHVALSKRSVNIANVYQTDKFDFSGTKRFDEKNGYRSCSFLTVPLLDHEEEVIAVLQLINAKDAFTDEIIAFSENVEVLIEAMAGYAATSLDNQILLYSHKELLNSFIKSLARIIDVRSPYTSAHCQRIPVLTKLIAEAACDAQQGYFSEFALTSDQWYELNVAAWMHDCGKLATPDSIIDKATKLNLLFDGIETIKARFAAFLSQVELDYFKQMLNANTDIRQKLEQQMQTIMHQYRDDLAFLVQINKGGEFMDDAAKARVRVISYYQWCDVDGDTQSILTPEDVKNLCITRGTINDSERAIINRHINITIEVLEGLPFPKNLRRVPEIAGGHHERMDGKGYPRGLTRDELSIPARIMGVADIFEALTAKERPYKPPMPLSQVFSILQKMKHDGHIDPDIFDLFLTSGKWQQYGEEHMLSEQMDVHLKDVGRYLQ